MTTKQDRIFVSLQLMLFVFYVIVPDIKILNLPLVIKLAGLIIGCIGFVPIIIAYIQIKNWFTAYPSPKDNAELITTGIYKFARHPMYTGVLLICFGFSLYFLSLSKLILSGCFLVFFYIKSKYEEKRLIEKFPAYMDYKEKTGRFF